MILTHHRRFSLSRRGFTLVELVVASAISSILLLAIGGSIVLASKALPEASPATAMSNGVMAMSLIADDLEHAKTISRVSATGVELTLPDRDGDAADETVSYSWNGTAGTPLLREVNGGGGAELLKGADRFALTLRTVVEGDAPRTLQQQTPEQTVFAGVTGTTTSITLSTSAPVMEIFKPSLPAGATSWTLERLDMYMSSSGTRSASMVVSLYELDLTLLPLGSAIVAVTVNETSMPSALGWYSIPIGRVQGLNPNKTYGLIITQTTSTSGNAATLTYVGITAADGAANGSIANKVLIVWLQDTSKRLACQIRGTALVSVTTPDTRRTVVKEVGVELRPTGSLKGVSTGVKLLNEPVAP